MRVVGFLSLCIAAMVIAPVAAKGIKPGQYKIVLPLQEICLKNDGTWYGTSFNWGGHWVNNPASIHDKAVIFGNYSVNNQYPGYANGTLTVRHSGSGLYVDWYDWYDDLSYQDFIGGDGLVFEKGNCDPPFTGENTHAASQ